VNAQPVTSDEWMMGGSKDLRANAALGFSEAETALLAVQAYEYAWMKVGAGSGDGWRARIAWELATEFENLLHEQMHLDLYNGEPVNPREP
jgi:hypothetical protein